MTIVILTPADDQWEVPGDWNPDDNAVYVLGAGGGGAGGKSPAVGTDYRAGGGAGGGAIAVATNIPLTAGDFISIRVGSGGFGGLGVSGIPGGDSWFNGTSISTSSVGAKGGFPGLTNGNGFGGESSKSVGSIKFSGGNGYSPQTGIAPSLTGGAGGAAAKTWADGASATMSGPGVGAGTIMGIIALGSGGAVTGGNGGNYGAGGAGASIIRDNGSPSAVPATGYITLGPAPGSVVHLQNEPAKIIVNGVTFTYVANASSVGNHGAIYGNSAAKKNRIQVGSNVNISAKNTADVLNACTDIAVSQATYKAVGNTVYITHKVPGTVGNAFTLDYYSPARKISVSGISLTDGGTGVDVLTQGGAGGSGAIVIVYKPIIFGNLIIAETNDAFVSSSSNTPIFQGIAASVETNDSMSATASTHFDNYAELFDSKDSITSFAKIEMAGSAAVQEVADSASANGIIKSSFGIGTFTEIDYSNNVAIHYDVRTVDYPNTSYTTNLQNLSSRRIDYLLDDRSLLMLTADGTRVIDTSDSNIYVMTSGFWVLEDFARTDFAYFEVSTGIGYTFDGSNWTVLFEPATVNELSFSNGIGVESSAQYQSSGSGSAISAPEALAAAHGPVPPGELLLWLNYSSGRIDGEYDNSRIVTTLRDLSESSMDFAQSTPALAPKFVGPGTDWTGAGIQFDQSREMFLTSPGAISSWGEFSHMFLVLTIEAGDGAILSKGGMKVSAIDTGSIEIAFRDEYSVSSGSWQTVGSGINAGELAVIEIEAGSPVPTILIDGVRCSVSQISNPSGTKSDNASADMIIGSDGTDQFTGILHEVIVL